MVKSKRNSSGKYCNKRRKIDLSNYYSIEDMRSYVLHDGIIHQPDDTIVRYNSMIELDAINKYTNFQYYNARHSSELSKTLISDNVGYIINTVLIDDKLGIKGYPSIILSADRYKYIIQFGYELEDEYILFKLYWLSRIINSEYGYILRPNGSAIKVNINNISVADINSAINWLHNYVPRPNLKCNLVINKDKIDIAVRNKDLTLLYGIDQVERDKLLRLGINNLDQAEITKYLTEFQRNILSAKSTKLDDMIAKSISGNVYYLVMVNQVYGIGKSRVKIFRNRDELQEYIDDLDEAKILSWYPTAESISLRDILVNNNIVINGLLDYTLTSLQIYLKRNIKYPELLDYTLPLPDDITDALIKDIFELTKSIHKVIINECVDHTLDELEDIIDEVVEVEGLSKEEEKQFRDIYKRIIKDSECNTITIKNIIRSNHSVETKKKLIERLLMLSLISADSNEYNVLLNELKLYFNLPEDIHKIINNKSIAMNKILQLDTSNETKLNLLEKLIQLHGIPANDKRYFKLRDRISEEVKRIENKELTISEKIRNSKLPDNIKNKLLFEYNNTSTESGEYEKKIKWIETWLKLPSEIKEFPIKSSDSPDKIKEFYITIRKKLDESIYGLSKAKDMIIDYVFRCLVNPSAAGYIGLVGPKGVGKTHLVNSISQILDRPMIRINLAGCYDGSKLVGHSYTYIGSIPGEIVNGLIRSKIRNPIIYLDELDKISNRRDEITGILIHAMDPVQNKEFTDEYLGQPIDLSNVLWIASFNNKNNIDPILLDRLHIIEIEPYKLADKINIAKHYLAPEIRKSLGFTDNPLGPLEDDIIEEIVKLSAPDDGIRSIKHNLELIYSRINVWRLTNSVNINNITIDSIKPLINIGSRPELTYFL